MKALILDHDDSFTNNLLHWLKQLPLDIEIKNHTQIDSIHPNDFQLIVLSPGPKAPENYQHVMEWLNKLDRSIAVFGVCLGMQLMVAADGGRIQPYAPPKHGKKTKLNSILAGFSEMEVARYHSLICKPSENFEILATSDEWPMWIKHHNKKWLAVQFHPESFLTTRSENLLKYLAEWIKA